MHKKPLIAIVEHDPMLGMLFLEVLTEEGYATDLWTERAGADAFIRRTRPDLVILDLWLRQRGEGWQVFDALQRDPATRPIPVIVCADDTQSLELHGARQPCAILEKPFDLDLLVDDVDDAVAVSGQGAERLGSYAEWPMLALGGG
jgi:CheY-like chemotaxis protein